MEISVQQRQGLARHCLPEQCGTEVSGGSGVSTEREGNSGKEELANKGDKNEAATRGRERLATKSDRGPRLALEGTGIPRGLCAMQKLRGWFTVDIEASRNGEGSTSAEWVDGLGENEDVVMGCKGGM
ncbi:hypothetical protein M9H77_09800 [Catharanthus roseus]|uniref:Uncharacterized protein n=1 Tax=Catharanthus roseus TaxID=4058 RepID=A0ACC0C1S6_CATRO|nr:hypothetical protein M9H77_09800 [Catharanthus roseus]